MTHFEQSSGKSRRFLSVAVVIALLLSLLSIGTAAGDEAEPTGRSVVVRAKGETGEEQFELRAGIRTIATKTAATKWTSFEFDLRAEDVGEIQVEFINDYFDGSFDRNLWIDYVEVGGVRFESEAPSTFAEGAWNQGQGCAPGFRQSERITCGGKFTYAEIDNDGEISVPQDPYSVPIGSGNHVAKVRARGQVGGERFAVRVGPQVLGHIPVTKDWRVYELRAETLSPGTLAVGYMNDWGDKPSDFNLEVDYVELNGKRFQSEAPETFSNGTWSREGGCDTDGNPRTETLHCNGAFFYGEIDQTLIDRKSTQPLVYKSIESPFVCNGVNRKVGSIHGAKPGERIVLTSPQLGQAQFEATANVDGKAKFKWSCEPGAAGKMVEFSARSARTNRTTSFVVPTSDARPVPVDGAYFLNQEEALEATALDATGLVRLRVSEANKFKVGNTLAVPPTPGLPEGMFGEVTDIRADGRLVLAPVAVFEVVEDPSFGFVGDVPDFQVGSDQNAAGNEGERPADGVQSHSEGLSADLFECKGVGTAGVPSITSSFLGFRDWDGPEVVFDKGNLFRRPSFDVEVRFTAVLEVGLESSGGAKFTCSVTPKGFPKIPIGVIAGVPVTVQLAPTASISASVNGKFSTKFSQKARVTTAASMTNEVPRASVASTYEGFDAGQLEEGTKIEVFAGGKLEVALGWTGLNGSVAAELGIFGAYENFTRTRTAGTKEKCSAFEAGVRAALLVQLTALVFSWEEQIAEISVPIDRSESCSIIDPDPIDPDPIDPDPIDPNPIDPNPIDPDPIDPIRCTSYDEAFDPDTADRIEVKIECNGFGVATIDWWCVKDGFFGEDREKLTHVVSQRHPDDDGRVRYPLFCDSLPGNGWEIQLFDIRTVPQENATT